MGLKETEGRACSACPALRQRQDLQVKTLRSKLSRSLAPGFQALRSVARFAGNGGGGGNRTRVRRPSAPNDYVRSPVSDSPPPLPGAGASVASLSASRRASLKRGGPASLYHGAVSVGQAAYGETTRSLSCECQFLVGSCYVSQLFYETSGTSARHPKHPDLRRPYSPPFRRFQKAPICGVASCAPFLTYLTGTLRYGAHSRLASGHFLKPT